MGFSIIDENPDKNQKFLELSSHRNLDHKLNEEDKLSGKNNELRASVTSSGFCIEYRETLQQHYERVGKLYAREPPLLSNMQIGMDIGLQMYASGMQGTYGD